MDKYRFHLPGLMHLPVSKKYTSCAYTQKMIKFSKMMLSLGHEVYIYGAEGSEVPCTEFIQTHTLADIKAIWGDGADNELGYDWYKKGFNESKVAPKLRTDLFPRFIATVASEIRKRADEQDFFLNPSGLYYKPIEQAVGLLNSCEYGIGYTQSYLNFKAFESAFLMNFTYGGSTHGHMLRPTGFDRVIPNYFDPEDFQFTETKQEYILYLGRITYAKGVTIAVKVADALNMKLIIAGQGEVTWDPDKGYLKGLEFEVTSPNIEYWGFADTETRKMLLSNAKMVMVPSLYMEPFGGVNVEAQLSGTPVLATNWGAFPETIIDGKTGFLCHTNEEFIEKAKKVGDLDPKEIRRHAERYLMDNVKHEYNEWFKFINEINFN